MTYSREMRANMTVAVMTKATGMSRHTRLLDTLSFIYLLRLKTRHSHAPGRYTTEEAIARASCTNESAVRVSSEFYC